MTMMMALLTGSTICIRMRKCPAPSMRAASSSSSGMPAKEVRMMMMLYALAALGRMTAQMVFSSPRLRTSMNVGTTQVPFPNYIKLEKKTGKS